MPGYIYVASIPDTRDNLFYVGYTDRNVQSHLNDLYTQARGGVPGPFELELAYLVDDPKGVEQKAHQEFSDYRLPKTGWLDGVELTQIEAFLKPFGKCVNGQN